MDTSTLPLVVDDLPSRDYHAGPGISSSTLKRALRSLDHYLRSLEEDREPTDSMLLGSMVHTLVFEPETWGETYAMEPDWSECDLPSKAEDYRAALRTLTPQQRKAGGIKLTGKVDQLEMWCRECLPGFRTLGDLQDEWHKEVEGREVVEREDVERAQAIAASLHAWDAARLGRGWAPLLHGDVVAERSVWWRHDEHLLRARPDVYHLEDSTAPGLVVDLKTTADARPIAWRRTVERYDYALSAAMYMDGLRAAGLDAAGFIWVCVETAPPYAVAAYDASDWIDYGRRCYRQALDVIADPDPEPGYGLDVRPLDLPYWLEED